MFKQPLRDFLYDLREIGIKPNINGERYIIVKAISNDRWHFLPLKPSAAFRSSLQIIQPEGIALSLLKFLVKLLSYFSLQRIFPLKSIFLQNQKTLRQINFDEIKYLSFFSGTSSPHRKTTIEFIDKNGKILGFLKLTRSKKVYKLISKEIKTIKFLSKYRWENFAIPRIKNYKLSSRVTWLYNDTINLEKAEFKYYLTDLHLKALFEIMKKTSSLLKRENVENIYEKINILYRFLNSNWIKRIDTSIEILELNKFDLPTCLAHGDFKPSNLLIEQQKLYIFDWEYSSNSLPYFYDLITFIISTNKEKSVKEIFLKIIKSIKRFNLKLDKKTTKKLILFSLLEKSFFFLERNNSQTQSNNLFKWEEEKLIAKLIDYILKQIKIENF